MFHREGTGKISRHKYNISSPYPDSACQLFQYANLEFNLNDRQVWQENRQLTVALRRSIMLKVSLISLSLSLLLIKAEPANSAIRNAASCSASDIQAVINLAVTGDTVQLPACAIDWGSSSISINSKNITLLGAGIDSTVITSTAASLIYIGMDGANNSSRVSGMTLNVSRGKAGVIIDGEGWRIDHLKIVSTPAGALCDGVWAYGGHVPNLANGPTGLIDHMQLIDCRVLSFGWPDIPEHEGDLWSAPLGLGDGNAVYLEDSTMTFTANFDDLQDCNYGGRIVYRKNSFSGGGEIHAHSDQGWRGCRRWETYQNTVSTPFYTAIWYRGGTGVVFNNVLNRTGGVNFSAPIQLDNVRSGSDLMIRGTQGACNGTSFVDGNAGLSNAPGWPCRDQIGWNTDIFKWTVANTAPAQKHEPAYFWSNTGNGSAFLIDNTNGSTYNSIAPNYLQPNRDYYESGLMTIQTSPTTPFNGTKGVGFGALANRPTTCTAYGDGSGAGVGYWVTDQGEWDSKHTGADGQLYRCTATNTWTLYYTPFTYPHPLQKDSVVPRAPINAPTNLHIQI